VLICPALTYARLARLITTEPDQTVETLSIPISLPKRLTAWLHVRAGQFRLLDTLRIRLLTHKKSSHQ